MSTPTFDKNQWYYLYVNGDKGKALLGTNLYTESGTKGAVFFNTTNTASNSQRWQIFPVTVNETTVYTLRCKSGGPNGFLSTAYSETEETEGKTRPSMFRGDVASENAYWTFGSWGDGTWYMANAANGTGYHLNRKGSGIMAMSPNVTAPQNGQRWGFATIGNIDDEKYSSVSFVRATASNTNPLVSSKTNSSAETSPTTSANPSTNITFPSGLSTGVKTAIGAAVGGVLLIALVVLCLYFWKKQKQRAQYSKPQELPHDTYTGGNSSTTKYEMYHDGPARYEMQSTCVVEMPNHYPRAELSAYTHGAQARS